MANILIIDDDEMICEIIARRVALLGHRAEAVAYLKEGLKKIASGSFEVVFLDVNLPDGNGLEYLSHIRELYSKPEIIVITGKGDPDGAELAIKSGAWHYIQKPFTKEEITLQLVSALQYRQGGSGNPAPVPMIRDRIIGKSPLINECLDRVAQAAQSSANVLITGETGTGKELFANAVHINSPRRDENFVVVDCTVLPEKLVESVLFGHKKGAFTGADKDHDGLIKQADGGTLFLDEIGELPLTAQKAFLRVLQERCFRPVGAKKEEWSDFRLIAATNRDLDQMVKQGRFRQDLLFRLRTFIIDLPPLRKRTEDIEDIATYHMARFCVMNGVAEKRFSPEFFHMLADYEWPGNIRELVNAVERAMAMEPRKPSLFPKHLPDDIRAEIARSTIDRKRLSAETTREQPGLSDKLPKLKDLRERSIAELECQYLKDLIPVAGGNIREACQISGLGRARLYELMKKYKIYKTSECLS